MRCYFKNSSFRYGKYFFGYVRVCWYVRWDFSDHLRRKKSLLTVYVPTHFHYYQNITFKISQYTIWGMLKSTKISLLSMVSLPTSRLSSDEYNPDTKTVWRKYFYFHFTKYCFRLGRQHFYIKKVGKRFIFFFYLIYNIFIHRIYLKSTKETKNE